ncbi:MAG TPA: DUF503 domain-containing protein [Planctomycetota bacterium]|nr:DUF503 domain-containing protein [Planctomycetota bacterium]
MIIGSLKFRLHLRDCHSLKEKRRVIKSLKDQLSNKFNISVAEVEDQDQWQVAEIGIAAVGTDTAFVQSVLSSVEGWVRFFGGVTVIDTQTETFGD